MNSYFNEDEINRRLRRIKFISMLQTGVNIILGLGIFIMALVADKEITKLKTQLNQPERRVDQWQLQSYQYVITLQDDDWIEVRHSDGTIVGQVRADTTTEICKLFYKDNE